MSPRPVAPSQLLIHEIAPDQVLEGYRIVKIADPTHHEFADSFRSHYEEGMSPRYEETQHTALHMAVSLWRDQEQAMNIARSFPAIGEHVAQVRLTSGQGVNYLDPSAERNPQHLTVWGPPATLAAAVVDIVSV